MLCVPAVWAAEPVSEVPPPHQSVVLDSAVMKEQRRINVYLPSTLQEERRYPVIYMPDGGLAEDFPHVANTIDAAIREGRMAPVILVGIDNTQRRRDMTGPTTVKKDRKIAPVVGGAAEFRKFIATELVPWVEANHPASERRGIIGESAAGLFIVETFFEMPGLFETSIAWIPACGGTPASWQRTRQPGWRRTQIRAASCSWRGRSRRPSARTCASWRMR